MRLEINGKIAELPAGATLADVIERHKLARQRVAVERNGRVVPRAEFGCTVLAEGDRLEIVTLVGGG
ncbi:MAG: hypothetical protein BIFFINMI_02101 [Phycisphaerae bacterium]|nr:hypothetical protein [Phycisphaerae bacterium]